MTSDTSNTAELKERVEAKRKRVEARIHEMKADAAAGRREKARQLENELDDIKQRVKDGYDNLKNESVNKLNDWLKD